MIWRAVILVAAAALPAAAASWKGTLRDGAGRPAAGAVIELRGQRTAATLLTTGTNGRFSFAELAPGAYAVSVQWNGKSFRLPSFLRVTSAPAGESSLEMTLEGGLRFRAAGTPAIAEATGGEDLSGKQVAALPLNKRDFAQLLLLAAGTMTDTNGSANFTQQFAINGQRGTAAVFAMDGIYTSDPEAGGATFSNFNVDAIQEIRSLSGIMPAEIGRGAAGFTEVVTKSGTDTVHGTLFEFVRNAAFDARNFFDRRSTAQPGRIPPFARNEFGFTIGGPVVLPGYNGRGRTYFFGQYQGFRQVLGTTQVLSVPTPAERQGRNTTAFPGDTLLVPVHPAIDGVLNHYPLPNDPQGPFGPRTYAASSKVTTVTDQFSVRIDHRISGKAQLFTRFNFNQVTGPVTNPGQTAIDPSFAIRFFDHQRNAGVTYTRTPSASLTWEVSAGFLRSTPSFPTINRTQPALRFADGVYDAFNSAGGSVGSIYGNIMQLRHNLSYVRGSHTFKAGVEFRQNRDSAMFGVSANGDYTFGGGTAYSPVEIRSLSGMHDIHPGDPLPDSLTGFLTGTPFSYTTAIAPAMFAQGEHIGESAIRREAANFYFQDVWKISRRISLNYGLRYELNTPISEARNRTAGAVFLDANGRMADAGERQAVMVNLRPAWSMSKKNFGPRLGLDWRLSPRTVFRAGAAITNLVPNLYADNVVTGGSPFVLQLLVAAAPGAPVPFQNAVSHFNLPPLVTPAGNPVFATGSATDVPRNTPWDVMRFAQDMADLSPDHLVRPLMIFGTTRNFADGYIGTYTASLQRDLGDVRVNAGYVATAGVHLHALETPNGYPGAAPAWAPYTLFDSGGRVTGGFGPEYLISSRAHSTFHSLQTSVEKNSMRAGLGFQASYTFAKSLDDTTNVLGVMFSPGSGTVGQTLSQDPRNWRAEKGPSTFDTTHVVTFSLLKDLPVAAVGFFRPLGRAFTAGWQLLNITTLTSGAPFTVYSGVQQTGAGSANADRPDQIGKPVLSTGRTIREDYFGLGARNPSFFSIPIGLPGGSGPTSGRFGTLGRNTFRGPANHNFDLALIKDTPLGRRGKAELAIFQFRAECFNAFNLVNLGLPANIVRSPGFGLISRTNGTSRQIQFSLKLLY